MIREIAPAKINLYLHVGPARRDGLHALESLFVFADEGDVIEAAPAADLSLDIIGPFAGPLSAEPVERNLVMRAARKLKALCDVGAGARITLAKRLPIASGVGGGSADAAATLRALMRLWNIAPAPRELARLAFSLGADVPACLDRRPVLVGGAGEIVKPAPALPPLWVCLANPGVAMPTGPVFRAFDAENPAPAAPAAAPFSGAGYALVEGLFENSRNDLQPIAIWREPVIQTVIERLAARRGALGARMSGSGATAFGLFSSAAAAARAAQEMAGRGWWSMSAKICSDRGPSQRVEY